MRTRLTTGAVLAAAVALAGSALAAPSVTVGSVDVDGSAVTVTGTASFDGPGNGVVGGTLGTAAPDRSAFAPAGVDLTSASILPTADRKALTFTWKVAGLPASPPPELTRYTWSFAVGEKTYQLQAKRSNAVSITTPDDPSGHVTSAAAGAFQLRGNCGTFNATPVANCPHLKFLTGAFDSAKGEVRMVVPLTDLGITTPTLLTPVETATMSIAASVQAVVSNTTTSTYINGWTPYATGPLVGVATGLAGDADQSGLVFTPATLTGGTFTGTAGIEEGTDAVVVRACEGTVCSYATESLS